MPATINGIGTTYYGKKNLESYEDVCDSCNRRTTLSDYETGHYFCVIFIPIIPLGRKMILGDCSICRRHRVLNLKEWERIKQQSIDEGVNALSANAKDPDKAIELLGTYSAFKQYAMADKLAEAVKSQHADHYKTMLALGGWYESRQKQALADECFEQCLQLDYDCSASKRIRCFNHLEKNEVDAARTLASELFQESPHENAALMFSVAAIYRQQNQDPEAYELYQQLLMKAPEFADDKSFAKEIRKMEKSLGIVESIVPKKGWFS